MRFFIVLLVVSIGTFPRSYAQNKYIPEDPYSITTDKQHFSRYLIVSPGFFGPNALPVPRLADGKVHDKLWISLEYEYYYQEGETTRDLYSEIHIPIAGGKASLDFNYVPFEFYAVDSLISRERRSASGSRLEGSANGDVYFGTHVQLINDHAYLPDLTFGMVCRTASGTMTEDARFTNTPGYYLDLSAGKTFPIAGLNQFSLRCFALIGFYVWQTFLDDYPQNDALLYGGGIDLTWGRISLLTAIKGYNGYMNNGDHPIVWRSELELHQGSAALVVGYEKGIRDFPFSCIRTGFRINGLTDQ